MARTPRQRRSRLAAGSALLTSWFLLGACAAPTEIRLKLYTDVACTDDPDWKGIAVYVGGVDSNLENKAPALTAASCDKNGQIGSLVIVPSGSKDDEVGLRVVAGIGQSPEDCASHGYQGCIVARRSLRFSPHSTIDLDITLTADCRGIGCDAAHTCLNGTCTDRIAQPSLSVVPDAPSEPSVRCGDNGIFCPTSGNVCCLTVDQDAGTTSGECKPGAQCTGVVLYCDDESDCASFTDDQGRVGMCLLSYANEETGIYTPKTVSGSQCTAHAGTQGINYYGLELCQDRRACLGGKWQCREGDPNNPLPGYYWCLFDVSQAD